MFSYEDQQQEYYQHEDAAKTLIDAIIEFNRNYKRKPKKFRKVPSLQEPNGFQEKAEGSFLPFHAKLEEGDDELEDNSDEIRPLMKVEVPVPLLRPSSRNQ